MDTKPARPSTSRRFTLLDGMILIVALGLVLGAARWLREDGSVWSLFLAFKTDFAWEWDRFDFLATALLVCAMTIAVPTTLAALVMRLRQPRHRWRKLARQPGLVACLVPLPSLAAALMFTVLNVLSVNQTTPVFKNGTTYAQQASVWVQGFAEWGALLGGFAVLVAWSTLILGGRWRPEPTWLDRLGRLIGMVWIVLALVACFALRNINSSL
jgi:hypothetical protein